MVAALATQCTALRQCLSTDKTTGMSYLKIALYSFHSGFRFDKETTRNSERAVQGVINILSVDGPEGEFQQIWSRDSLSKIILRVVKTYVIRLKTCVARRSLHMHVTTVA